MSPRITRIADTHPIFLAALSELPTDAQAFLIEESGDSLGRHWEAGEVIVCVGKARAGDWVMLLPSGVGRIRLGERRGGRLIGDLGDVCSERRWSASGRIVAVLRPRTSTAVELLTVALLGAAPAGWALVAGLVSAPFRRLRWAEVGEVPVTAAPAPSGWREVARTPATVPAASSQLELFAA
jgi:hypothetical protein